MKEADEAMDWRLLICLLFLLLQGCSHVEPWERGSLASPAMAAEPLPLQSPLRDHVYSSRENRISTRTRGAGGCGCY